MATMIHWKNKTILQCSNSIAAGLYECILDVIRDQNLFFNTEISELIERLELCGSGWHINLADYIHSKENLKIFIDLVRKGINKQYEEIQNLPQHTKDFLENFYLGLLEIYNNFQA